MGDLAVKIIKLRIYDDYFYIKIDLQDELGLIALKILDKIKHNICWVPTPPEEDRQIIQMLQRKEKLKLITGEGEAFSEKRNEIAEIDKFVESRKRYYESRIAKRDEINKVLQERNSEKAIELVQNSFDDDDFNQIHIYDIDAVDELLELFD